MSSRSRRRPDGCCIPARWSTCACITWSGPGSRSEPAILRPRPLAVDEGLHLARHCGLGLYHIELLAVRAELFLSDSQPAAAEQAAREALRMASDPKCQFRWGAAEAGDLLGKALLAQDRLAEGMEAIKEARKLRL